MFKESASDELIAKKAYGVAGSAVNKLLSINVEVDPERIFVIMVKKPAGY